LDYFWFILGKFFAASDSRVFDCEIHDEIIIDADVFLYKEHNTLIISKAIIQNVTVLGNATGITT
jgi:hypothetical protein